MSKKSLDTGEKENRKKLHEVNQTSELKSLGEKGRYKCTCHSSLLFIR